MLYNILRIWKFVLNLSKNIKEVLCNILACEKCNALIKVKNGRGYLYCQLYKGHSGLHQDFLGNPLSNDIVCHDCRHPIHDDDDAHICIQCGGRNSRVRKQT